MVFPDFRLTRRFGPGVYLGARAAAFDNQVILLPIAGAETGLGSGVRLWAATEPALEITPFRETFVRGGDWNLPDFSLPAMRRDLDVRGGVRWTPTGRTRVEASFAWYHANHVRTWRGDEGYFVETAAGEAVGRSVKIKVSSARIGPVELDFEGQRQWVEDSDGGQIAYHPTHTGTLELGYGRGKWHGATSLLGVQGRHDENGAAFGSFVRWDAEAAYRPGSGLEYTLRLENIADAEASRWPGFPSYGRGIYGGVRLHFGS